MSDFITKLSELIDPEVMGDMVSARIPKKLRVAPFAKIDDTLQGVPGDTITVPAYTYIGDASDVAEGGEVAIEKMTTSTRKATIKKAMKGIGLTDEAVLSGYGNPVGEANTQLAQAIAAKVDNDCMDALQTASLIYDGSQAQISYNAIVDAVDLFEEEMGCSDKVLFIHPKQVTQLRKNPDFRSADKYTPGVSLTGEIGMIAGCRLVPSKKVPLAEGVYACPIVKLETDPEVDDEIPALTIYRKREVNIETERKPKTRTTEITAEVARIVRTAQVATGLANVFVLHTSCSVILTENADPTVRRDLETLAARWAPDGDSAYRHDDEGDDDMAAHGRNILAGSSITEIGRAHV